MKYDKHISAVIDDGAQIGDETNIWHFSQIMPGCVIGERCNIGQNILMMPGVVFGNNVKVQNNVSICNGVICEDDVFLGPSMVCRYIINCCKAIVRKDEYRHHCKKGNW